MNSNNINSDLISIDDLQQQTNETLFWKVFHNKYIRNNIIGLIESMVLPAHSYGERIKFKDLTSFDWFFLNNQFSLLKCKLEANENIEMYPDRITDLLDKIYSHLYHNEYSEDSDYFQIKEEYMKGDEFIDDSSQIAVSIYGRSKRYSYQISNAIQSLKLLLKLKSNETTSNILNYGRHNKIETEMLQEYILIEPYIYSLAINEDTFKSLVSHLSPSTLDKVLSNLKKTDKFNTTITDNIKNNIVYWASNNQFYTEMIEYILNDNQLYNVPLISISNKRLKLSSLSSDQSENSHIQISIQQQDNNSIVTKLDVMTFLKNKSSTIQQRLLNLNYIKIPNTMIIPDEIKNQILEVLHNNNYDDQIDNSGEIRIKSLFKLYSTLNNQTYSEYLIKYDEPIDGADDTMVLIHSILTKSVFGLKYLLSKDDNTLDKIKSYFLSTKPTHWYSEIKSKLLFSDKHLEFIKLYTTNYRLINIGNTQYFPFEYEILEFIFSIKSNQEYEILSKLIVRTIENKSFTDKIPQHCNLPCSLLELINKSNQVIIQDTNTIDLINNSNYIQLFCKFKPKSVFKFGNYKLIEYLKSNYGGGGSGSSNGNPVLKVSQPESSSYIFSFSLAINNCDIESLKQIDQLLDGQNIKFNEFEIDESINEIKYSKFVLKKINKVELFKNENEYYNQKGKSSEPQYPKYSIKSFINFNYQNNIGTGKINELLEYFNSSGYKLFSKELFKKFINDISKLGGIGDTIDLSKLKINFQQFQVESMELIFDSISFDVNPNAVQLVLNNINPFSLPIEIIQPIINKWENSIDSFKETSYFKHNNYIGDEDCFNQISIAHETYEDERVYGPYCSYSYQSSNDIIQCIKLLLNHFKSNYYGNNNTSNTNKNNDNIIFQNIINYLFIRLIKVYAVGIDEIKQTYQHIQLEWLSITGGIEFQFKHSVYHIFFYLGIRSNELMDYLIKELKEHKEDLYSIGEFTDICDNEVGNICIPFDIPSNEMQFPLKKPQGSRSFFNYSSTKIPFYPLNILCSNVNIFSYDFIFNAPIYQIFEIINLKIDSQNSDDEDNQN